MSVCACLSLSAVITNQRFPFVLVCGLYKKSYLQTALWEKKTGSEKLLAVAFIYTKQLTADRQTPKNRKASSDKRRWWDWGHRVLDWGRWDLPPQSGEQSHVAALLFCVFERQKFHIFEQWSCCSPKWNLETTSIISAASQVLLPLEELPSERNQNSFPSINTWLEEVVHQLALPADGDPPSSPDPNQKAKTWFFLSNIVTQI